MAQTEPYEADLRHLPTPSGQRCVLCGEPWPCRGYVSFLEIRLVQVEAKAARMEAEAEHAQKLREQTTFSLATILGNRIGPSGATLPEMLELLKGIVKEAK